MGIISNLVPDQLKTSGMKGMTSGQYGQSGIVGTIIKMYLGDAIGGALGGASGGGASGIAGASNGLSSVTSNLGSMFSGGGAGAGAGAGGGGLGGLGGILGGEGGGGLGSILGGGGEGGAMGTVGNIAQNLLNNSGSNGGGGDSKSAPDMSQPQVPDISPNAGMEQLTQMSKMGQQSSPDTGLASIPGIPDYILNMMKGWK